ncbi:hypothetical protein BATDEDRAFT_25080 [Batrachochytrium dendrobatidis JAM81]|uniref:Velvet domain-containing protein n=1 Tax=Batrachochytrium dendrobatidis (strain JAM81 / FGSC 10211) TaxID=684364 RepID=F4P3I2_BATDJ|nr:uncharacterized protein BATDEDRAFT_25080 [Batrachochytrium dendrobatidis JAM81]EGF80224.1 hypothetical protein BATDEDRAFT_25080 [Batrachochytrium dendrobatidis JAM81]|eukprot:XP_006679010.1 hypothetical protein BATDEDRAFT_25080 [Batrachochytrium dendrobatidis JAM81]
MSHEYEKIKLNTNTPQSTSAPPATNHNAAAEDWPVLEGSFVKDSGHSKQLFSEPQHTIQGKCFGFLLTIQCVVKVSSYGICVTKFLPSNFIKNQLLAELIHYPNRSGFKKPAQQATQTAQVPESIDTQAHRRMPPDFLASFTSPTTKRRMDSVCRHQIPRFLRTGITLLVICITSYTLCIVQHPLQARMSGYSIRDRRPLDPTPIVQVVVPDDISDLQSFEDSPFLVAQASLWKPDMHTELCTAASAPVSDLVAGTAPAPDLPPKSRNSQILLGSIVVACQLLTNIAGERGLYFVFTDLSIRTSGFFRLQISLYDLRRATPRMRPVYEIFSNEFQVFTPKAFPGMSGYQTPYLSSFFQYYLFTSLCFNAETTLLCKHFIRQGVRIHTRSDQK